MPRATQLKSEGSGEGGVEEEREREREGLEFCNYAHVCTSGLYLLFDANS